MMKAYQTPCMEVWQWTSAEPIAFTISRAEGEVIDEELDVPTS